MRLIFASLLIAITALTGCSPNDKERAAAAEAKRVECLDQFCEGDVDPRRGNYTKELLKLNGQWFLGDKEYFSSGRGGATFYWPSKTPGFRGGSYPEAGQDFHDKAIQIFMKGRQRWPEPNAIEPWNRESKFEIFWRDAQAQGYRIERSRPTPELEVVQLLDAQGNPHPHKHMYFIATQQKTMMGNRSPAISCDAYTQRPHVTCTGGDFWKPNVFVDYRFSAAHANDWPAIHQEIIRVLSLIQETQP